MDLSGLRTLTAEALGKDPATSPENPEWDSLDKLEILTGLHEAFGEKANDIEDLDNFADLNGLAAILRERGLLE